MIVSYFSKHKIAICILLAFIIFFTFNVYFFDGSCYLNGDGLRHYLVSRWCWNHHDLLFYHWGKPFFTIVSSLFARFGFHAMQIYNIMIGAVGVWCLYILAVRHHMAHAYLIVPFAYCSTSFFDCINTGLTEPMFFSMIAMALWLVDKNKFYTASILLSFLPFVRSEGNIIIVLFVLYFLLRKNFLAIPLLAVGTLVYSIVGGVYYHDYFWVINQNPYDGKNIDIYGSGSLFYFLIHYQSVVGNPIAALFVFALGMFATNRLRKQKMTSSLPSILWLSAVCFLLYLVMHAIFWWQGLFNSLGLVRVMGGVAPLTAPLCLWAFNFIFYFSSNSCIRKLWLAATVFFVLYEPLRIHHYPYKPDREIAVIKQSCRYILQHNLEHHNIFYLNPYVPVALDKDAFNSHEMNELWGLYPSIKQWGYGVIKDSAVVVYDTHFGPNEAHIPIDTMLNDKHFILLKKFEPSLPFTVLGGYDYALYLFQKVQLAQ